MSMPVTERRGILGIKAVMPSMHVMRIQVRDWCSLLIICHILLHIFYANFCIRIQNRWHCRWWLVSNMEWYCGPIIISCCCSNTQSSTIMQQLKLPFILAIAQMNAETTRPHLLLQIPVNPHPIVQWWNRQKIQLLCLRHHLQLQLLHKIQRLSLQLHLLLRHQQ